jgi:hypothetical protein
MRIVGLEEFLALPNETLFCKYYNEASWGDLRIKTGLAAQGDYMFQNVLEVKADDADHRRMLQRTAVASCSRFSLDLRCPARDTLGHANAKFVVFEKSDVKAIMERLRPVMKAFEEKNGS